MIRLVLVTALLTGCSSTSHNVVTGNPLGPINVNCGYSRPMSLDLQHVIADPKTKSIYWENTFEQLSGNRNSEDRISSAKTILWTIRTRCPGF